MSLAQAKFVLEAVRRRLEDKGLELHPEKTKIVYCKDDNRKGTHDHQAFDYLSYTFRARSVMTKRGTLFVGFTPAISDKAKKGIRDEVRDWCLVKTMNNKSLEEIAKFMDPIVRGWVNYYGRFYRSECLDTLEYLNLVLARWAKRKYKRFHRNWMGAYHWLMGVAARQRTLFYHWTLAKQMEGRAGRAV